MLKVTSKEEELGYSFEIEDDTEDFDELGMQLATLIKYSYDAVLESARQGGAEDPEREASLYIDSIVYDAINGDIAESEEEQKKNERREMLHLVDNYMEKRHPEKKD